MKKFTLVSLVAAAAFATTAAFSASNVFAADETTTPASDAATPTDATKNPTKGTITLDKSDGSDNGGYTDITLTKASTIDFSNQAIWTTTHDYFAKTATDVQVINPGVASGWTVKASAGEFTGTGDTKGSLKGAELTLVLNDGTTEGATQSNAPTGTSDQGVNISKDAAAVLTAKDDSEGVGTWTATTDAAKTKLNVPAGNVAGSYSADITWTLENTVSAN